MKEQAKSMIEIEMIAIPAGVFLMGSNLYADSQPIHEVSVPAFQMGKYLITQAQYKAVMGNNPSHFKGDTLPVESVSWDEAQEFCRKLSEMTGQEYRLPTEAEWEYACRAGSTGDNPPSLDDGWFWENSDRRTHPVGEKTPNAFGLHDMHGNVWEWCEDVWHDDYSGAPTDGSAWLSATNCRVLRGGSWIYDLDCARAVCRSGSRPVNRVYDFDFGFRVVLGVRPPSREER